MVSTVLAAFGGATAGLGIFVAVGVAVGGPQHRGRPARQRPSWMVERFPLRATAALSTAAVVWAATGWPAGGMVAGVGAAAAPSVLGAKARRAAAMAKVEAIAGWAEQLRDVMAAAEGIQSAIVATAPLAPAPVRSEVARLAGRLDRRERLGVALRAFADDVAHPLADMVVTALVIAGERQGRLGDLLSEVAASARATANMRARVEAARARTYVTTRLLVGLTITMAVWLVVARRDYLAPFDSAGGQVMLVVIGSVFAGSAVAMQRMARLDEGPRLLAGSKQARR